MYCSQNLNHRTLELREKNIQRAAMFAELYGREPSMIFIVFIIFLARTSYPTKVRATYFFIHTTAKYSLKPTQANVYVLVFYAFFVVLGSNIWVTCVHAGSRWTANYAQLSPVLCIVRYARKHPLGLRTAWVVSYGSRFCRIATCYTITWQEKTSPRCIYSY